MEDLRCDCVVCGAVAYCRGLCSRHLKVARRLVRDGRASWAELEARGLARPAKPALEHHNRLWDYLIARRGGAGAD